MKHALKLLAILPLACASAAAAPDTPKPAPPATPSAAPAAPAPAPAPAAAHPDACRPAGAVMFQIEHQVTPGSRLPTSTVKVFGNGGWTRDELDADGKAAPQRTGCIAKPELKQLEATLHGATWKVQLGGVHCMAMTPTFTVFRVDGKEVFTDRVCNSKRLDEKSRAKLDAAVSQVDGELAKP